MIENGKSVLVLHLKKEWYNMVRRGIKRVEYRNDTEYWRKRLVGKHFDIVRLYFGYTPYYMDFSFNRMRLAFGNPRLGAPSGVRVFNIFLGKMLSYYERVS